jgi:hypothetical protein
VRRTGPLLALAAVLLAVGVAAVVWMLGGPSGDDAREAALTPLTLDASAPISALQRGAAALEAAAAAVGGGELDELLAQDPLTLDLPEVSRGGVTLRDVAVRRSGSEASVEATVDPAQLAALAPGEVDLTYDAEASAADGDAIVLSGTADALGFDVPVSVRVEAVDGAVVARPEGLPIGEQVLFDDPRVRVTSLRAEPLGDATMRVRAEARIAG